MSRWLALIVGLAVSLIPATAARATPRLCQPGDSGGYGSAANQPDPNGTSVTFLYAKIDGAWTEPENVCVAVRFHDSDTHNRYIAMNRVVVDLTMNRVMVNGVKP